MFYHYDDVIMGAMASQITRLTIVYSTVYSDADQRKHQSSASLAFCAGNSPGEFPAQMASNAENLSIWWRLESILAWNCSSSQSNDEQRNGNRWKWSIPSKCFLAHQCVVLYGAITNITSSIMMRIYILCIYLCCYMYFCLSVCLSVCVCECVLCMCMFYV